MKKVFKISAIISGIIALILVFQTMRIGMMFVDFQNTVKTVNQGDPSAPPRKLEPPELAINSMAPEGFYITGIMTSSLANTSSNSEKSLVKDEEIANNLGKLDKKLIEKVPQQLLKKLVKLSKDLPEPPPIPEVIDINAPMLNFRQMRDTARYWYLLGRYFSAKGNYNASLTCFTATSMLAHLVETVDSESSASLISRMIAIAIRNIAHTGLLECLPRYDLPAKNLKQWLGILFKLEKAMPSMARCFEAEKLLIPSVYHEKNMQVSSGIVKRMRDKDLQDKYLGAHYDPLIKACDSTFSEAMVISKKKSDELMELQTELFTPASIKYFFWPEEFYMQVMMSIAVPNSRKAFNQDFRCRNIMRGTIVLMAMQAYKADHKSYPDNLDSLQKWLNHELPQDIYVDQPFVYKPGSEKILFSVGEDGRPDTEDDIVFFPL